MDNINLYNMDCVDFLSGLSDDFLDLTVTSPPYDKLRTYDGYSSFWGEDKWKNLLTELFRVTKVGGVVVWVVSDSTVKGSETGTSFKQALFAKEIGFNLHDTMIYRKKNYTPLTHNRYEQEWEYIFCFSKGKPKTFNPIKVPCKYAGQKTWGQPNMYKTNNGELTRVKQTTVKDEKIKGNIFEYLVGSTQTGKINHPAMFPEQLAKDQIVSWSNEGDVICDPLMGSGTSGIACKQLNRIFFGNEINRDYFNLSIQRISEA